MMNWKMLFCTLLSLNFTCSAFSQEGTPALPSGATLKAGQRLVSPQKTHYLVMRADDGNLCIYTSKDVLVWSSMVTKGGDSYLIMQDDGNLVVYDRNNQPVWNTETQGFFDPKYSRVDWKPVRAALQDDGTLGLYTAANKRVWSSAASNPLEGFKGKTQKQEVNVTLPFAKGQKLIVEVTEDGMVIFQNDMILGNIADLNKCDPPAENAKSWMWPNSTIPYVLPSTHPKYDLILKGIIEISDKTNLWLVPRLSETDYVEFIDGEGHWATLGKQGGRQVISIDSSDEFVPIGIVFHEILHAAGFSHTQSREDRDNYVRINYGSIESGKEHNFQRLENKDSNIGAYNYESVMHYFAKAFSKDRKNTIDVNANVVGSVGDSSLMGTRQILSDGDIANVASIYGPAPCQATAPHLANNGGFTPPSAANQTKSTFKEPRRNIFVTNKTGQVLEAYWVNFEGQEVATEYFRIEAGAERVRYQEAHPGFLFRFKLNGNVYHTWMIEDECKPHLIIQ